MFFTLRSVARSEELVHRIDLDELRYALYPKSAPRSPARPGAKKAGPARDGSVSPRAPSEAPSSPGSTRSSTDTPRSLAPPSAD